MIAIRYESAMNGGYADTVAILPDGRKIEVNTQYGTASPLGKHAEGCEMTTRIGGRCNCGLLDGIDVEMLVIEARIRGMFGKYPNRIMTNAEHLRLEAQDALRDPSGLWNPEERKARHDILIQRAEGIEAQAEAATLAHGKGWCPKCESYCYGDCEASRG